MKYINQSEIEGSCQSLKDVQMMATHISSVRNSFHKSNGHTYKKFKLNIRFFFHHNILIIYEFDLSGLETSVIK